MAANGFEPQYGLSTPVLKQFSQRSPQPKDLISTLPQIHEKTVVSPMNALPMSPLPPSPSTPPISPAQSSPTARKARKRDKSNSISTQVVDASDHFARSRADSQTLQRNHYKPIGSAVKCAAPTCGRRFGLGVKRRNCCMCGEVFCRKCTKFHRKLSQSAEPDPLGASHPVCERCFNFVARSGRFRDRMYEFQEDRQMFQRERKVRDSIDFVKPLPQRERSGSKIGQVRSEVERLCQGFQAESNSFKGLFNTPGWHKSNHWVSHSKQSDCFECNKKLKMTNRKINCRICGQVFCTACTKSEILLYCFQDGLTKWAINGKEGGPSSKPRRFETLPICNHCCQELEDILLTDLQGPTEEEYNFLDETVAMQKELIGLQTKIEHLLSNYQKLVDSMDIEDSSPRSVSSQHSLQELAKAQADISDTFSFMANKSQALKKLQAETETQMKLVKHLMTATFEFYSEHMLQFYGAQLHMKEMMPMESLTVIQRFLDQQSIERVHLLLQQILCELLSLQEQYKFEDAFVQYLVQVDACVEEEFKPYLTRQGENWEEHIKNVQAFIKKEIVENPWIKIKKPPRRNHPHTKEYIRYVVLSRATSLVAECSRELEAKTREEIFPKTKASLAAANKTLDGEFKKITVHF